MSKKDEEIAELKEINANLLKAAGDDHDKMEEVLAKNKGLTVNNQQLNSHLEEMNVQHASQIEAFKEKFQEFQDYKKLMIVNVNITGVQDIGKTLDDSVTLLTGRLQALDIAGDYRILAVPQTMSIGIVG